MMKTFGDWMHGVFDDKITAAFRHLLKCGVDPNALAIPENLPRYMRIRESSTTWEALVFKRDDVSIVEFRTRRDEPGNCFLHCKVCPVAMWLASTTFAHYYTREFAEAALAEIQAAFDAGESEIDVPKVGLAQPFKSYRNGKIVDSWNF